jgi:AraC family transcriptional regulator of arabinose operon
MRLLLSEIDVSAGTVTYPPGGSLGPRRQQDLELVLIHEGSASVTVDGAPRATLRAGDVGLLLPGHRELFAFAHDAPTRHSWVQGRPLGAPLDRLAALPAVLPASTALTELVLAAAAGTPLSTRDPLVAALGTAALWRYVGEAEARVRGPSDPVACARAYVHAHAGDQSVDLARIAAAAHVTPAHLVRRFRAELGITPMAYLWQRRVAIGLDLLTGTGLPIGTVAERAGFKSSYHFSRRVRAHAGVPPSEVRRAAWEGQAPAVPPGPPR